MKKVFSIIGYFLSIFFLAYILIFVPINYYIDKNKEVDSLKKELVKVREENQNIIKNYDAAIRANLDATQINQIYSDSRYFNQSTSKSEIKTTEIPRNYKLKNYE